MLQIPKINESVDGRNLVHYAADYGQDQVLEYLISKSANVNVSDSIFDQSNLILIWTCWHPKQMQVKDKHGITPLLAAIWEGHTECVSILLRGGADKTGTAPDGTSYVDAAEKNEIKALLA